MTSRDDCRAERNKGTEGMRKSPWSNPEMWIIAIMILPGLIVIPALAVYALLACYVMPDFLGLIHSAHCLQ